MKERKTPNALVRRSIEEIMPLDKPLYVSEIKELLLEERGLAYARDYTEGNLSNALYVLSNAGILKKMERGLYQKAESDFMDGHRLEREKKWNWVSEQEDGKNPEDKQRTEEKKGIEEKKGTEEKKKIEEKKGTEEKERIEEKERAGTERRQIQTYEIKEVLHLFKRSKDKLQEISDDTCAALKNVNLCSGATDQEFEALRKMLEFKDALGEMLENFVF